MGEGQKQYHLDWFYQDVSSVQSLAQPITVFMDYIHVATSVMCLVIFLSTDHQHWCESAGQM